MSTSLTTEQQRDAVEFGTQIRSKGWRLGLLVARNVREGSKGGRPRKDETAKPIISDRFSADDKVTGAQWSVASGVSQPQISYTLKAWNLAAADGLVPISTDIVPGQEIEDLPIDAADWSRYYNLAKVPDKPRTSTASTPTTPTTPKAKGRKPMPGTVVAAKIEAFKSMRADYPEKATNPVALGKLLGWSHQDVIRYGQLADAPTEIRDQVIAGDLKLAVAQEILQAPVLSPTQQVKLAHKFVSGILPQTGQASGKIRPFVAFVQSAYADVQREFLDTPDMLFADAERRQAEATDRMCAAKTANAAADAAASAAIDGIQWAANLHTGITKHNTALGSFLDQVSDPSTLDAVPVMKRLDPFTSSQIVKELQRTRELLNESYNAVGALITAFGGEVNHPETVPTATAFIDSDSEFIDAPRISFAVVDGSVA